MLKKNTFLNKNSIFVLFLTLFFTNAFSLNSDSQKAAHLSANHVKYNRINHVSFYNGNVKFSQGTTSLSADKLVIYDRKNNNKIYKIVAFGKRAHYSTLPEGKKYLLHAKANIIEYYPQRNIAILIGNAEITQNHNNMRGHKIKYNTKLDTVLLTPSSTDKIRVVFQP